MTVDAVSVWASSCTAGHRLHPTLLYHNKPFSIGSRCTDICVSCASWLLYAASQKLQLGVRAVLRTTSKALGHGHMCREG
jgi:hypothetical protein